MRLQIVGTLLCLATVSCRTDSPPPTDICIGDGIGGADCTLKDGSHSWLSPSQLDHAWIIPTQDQAKAYIAWCYDTDADTAESGMSAERSKIMYARESRSVIKNASVTPPEVMGP